MSNPELAIAGFYDHEHENERRAPDWGGDDLFATAPTRRRRFDRDRAPHHPTRLRETSEHPLPARAAAPRAREERPPEAPRAMEPVPAGRRTVTITGRPQGLAVTRRPARSLDERIANRPERIASWTCAMGFLLILLAVLTSH